MGYFIFNTLEVDGSHADGKGCNFHGNCVREFSQIFFFFLGNKKCKPPWVGFICLSANSSLFFCTKNLFHVQSEHAKTVDYRHCLLQKSQIQAILGCSDNMSIREHYGVLMVDGE